MPRLLVGTVRCYEGTRRTRCLDSLWEAHCLHLPVEFLSAFCRTYSAQKHRTSPPTSYVSKSRQKSLELRMEQAENGRSLDGFRSYQKSDLEQSNDRPGRHTATFAPRSQNYEKNHAFWALLVDVGPSY